MKENLVKKFLTFSYGSGVGLIIGFITTVVSARLLTPEDFGKAAMFTLAINVCMIFIVFGTDQSFVRFFYEETEENRGGLLYNCLKAPVIIMLVSMIILFAFYKKLSFFLFGESRFDIVLLLAVGIITQVIYRYSVLVIRMQKKGNLFSLLGILNKAMLLGFTLLFFVLIKPGYEIIVYSTVFTFIITTVISIILEKKFWSFKNLSVKNLKHSKKEIFHYSYPLVLTTLITWLFQSFDRIALRQWSDFHELGLFAAAFKIVALLNVIQVAFTTFWTPVCFEAFEKNPNETKLFETVSKVVAFFMFILAILTIMFKGVIVVALGSKYANASLIMPFMVFMPIMYTLSETTVIGINFFKKPKWHILIAVTSCLSNIILNWILVPKYGALGAAISTASSYVVFFTLRTVISLKYYKVKYGLIKIYIMMFFISLYGFFAIQQQNSMENWIAGCILLVISFMLYFKDLYTIYLNVKKVGKV